MSRVVILATMEVMAPVVVHGDGDVVQNRGKNVLSRVVIVNSERGGCPCCALATAKGVRITGGRDVSRVDHQRLSKLMLQLCTAAAYGSKEMDGAAFASVLQGAWRIASTGRYAILGIRRG